MNPIYQAMLAESQRRGAPAAHETDLTVHDRAWLEANPGRPFAWALCDRSTHLYPPDFVDGVGHDAISIVECIARSFGVKGWYWCDGKRLRQVDRFELIELIRRWRDDQIGECPSCGDGMHQCETGDPGCYHCNSCDYMVTP